MNWGQLKELVNAGKGTPDDAIVQVQIIEGGSIRTLEVADVAECIIPPGYGGRPGPGSSPILPRLAITVEDKIVRVSEREDVSTWSGLQYVINTAIGKVFKPFIVFKIRIKTGNAEREYVPCAGRVLFNGDNPKEVILVIDHYDATTPE